MKKLLSVFLVLFLSVFSVSVTMSGCSSYGSSQTEVADDVEFELLDVLKITNDTTNTTYYYFLARLTNNGDADYSMSDLSYSLAYKEKDSISSLHAMDKFQSTITATLATGHSSSVYGYYGFPSSSQKDVGLQFANGNYVSFASIKERTINDENITNSMDSSFVIYEDEYFEFEVDTSNILYSYKNGVSVVSGLVLTYKNKTDQTLVVPYLTPICTIDGLSIYDYGNAAELKNMSLDELKKQDFTTSGMAPKTSSYTGEALNYQLYYLEANQEVPCNIAFTFNGIIPDFSDVSESTANTGVTININSTALGYSQLINVPYLD